LLLKRAVLDRIAAGEVDLVFRRWQRPTVKTGGRLRTAVGELAIVAVEPVRRVLKKDARRAGYADAEAVLADLRDEGQLYRIEVRLAGPDSRLALRESRELGFTLPSWGAEYLRLIASNEGVRAPELAERLGLETRVFKGRVRRLKELGLTESLRVGYRLAPRGQAWLEAARG
jgi:hypothetical protein